MWLTHVAVGRRPQLLISRCQVISAPHHVGPAIGWLKCSHDVTAGVFQSEWQERECAEESTVPFMFKSLQVTRGHTCHILFMRNELLSHTQGRRAKPYLLKGITSKNVWLYTKTSNREFENEVSFTLPQGTCPYLCNQCGEISTFYVEN